MPLGGTFFVPALLVELVSCGARDGAGFVPVPLVERVFVHLLSPEQVLRANMRVTRTWRARVHSSHTRVFIDRCAAQEPLPDVSHVFGLVGLIGPPP